MPEKTRTLTMARKRPVRTVQGRDDQAYYLVRCRCRSIVPVPVGGAVVVCSCGQRWKWPLEPQPVARQVVIAG